jgi:hypothetical protein
MKPVGVLLLVTLLSVGVMAADNPPPPAAAPESETPGFADGWRLSGILKQGGRLQASLEHTTRTPRFVVEGSELVAGVRVEKIDSVTRTVTVRRGNLIAIIHCGSSPVVVKSSPVIAQTAPPPAVQESQSQTLQRLAPTAGQDAAGRWGIQLSDGRFFSAEDYAARFGGVEQAMDRLNNRLASDLPPERKVFAQQMLTALQNAQQNQPQSSSNGGTTAATAGNTTVYSAASAAPTAPVPSAAPAVADPVEVEPSPMDVGNLQPPARVYRPGPQLNR